MDDLQLVVVPVVLAEGLRLLDGLEGSLETAWRLVESSVLGDGAVAVHYARRRAGED